MYSVLSLAFCVLLLIGFIFMYEKPNDLDSTSRKSLSRASRVKVHHKKKYSRFISKQPSIPVYRFTSTRFYKKSH